MKNIFKVLVLIALFAVYGFSASNGEVKEILKLSGLNKQIASLPAMVEAGARQARATRADGISDEEFVKILAIIKSAFEPTVILDAVSKGVQKDISSKDAQNLISWFKSKLGKKIVLEETKASSANSMQEMLQSAKELLSNHSRVALAIELDKLTHSSKIQANMMLNMRLAMVESFAKESQKENIKQQLISQQNRVIEYAKKMSIISFLYVYRNLSINDIEKYINFLKTPSAQKFNDSFIKSYSNEMDVAVKKMAKDLAILKAKYKQ